MTDPWCSDEPIVGALGVGFCCWQQRLAGALLLACLSQQCAGPGNLLACCKQLQVVLDDFRKAGRGSPHRQVLEATSCLADRACECAGLCKRNVWPLYGLVITTDRGRLVTERQQQGRNGCFLPFSSTQFVSTTHQHNTAIHNKYICAATMQHTTSIQPAPCPPARMSDIFQFICVPALTQHGPEM